jgi:tRNA (adenine57-N1/adenine58-N1)-methyltransferase
MSDLNRFVEGELVLLVDRKDRRYLFNLADGESFHSHGGIVYHAALIGQEKGVRIRTNTGQVYYATVPTLADYVTNLPRASQVVYPKDIGGILMVGDIFPGADVIEAGMGSGALTMALLRAIGPEGHLSSYEIRDEAISQARENISVMAGAPENFRIRSNDIYDGIVEDTVDRIILDLPEPWRVIENAAQKLVPGGIIVCFLPTIIQVHNLAFTLQTHSSFEMVESIEILLRPWYIAANSARPMHRMVGHTGFLVSARKCAGSIE